MIGASLQPKSIRIGDIAKKTILATNDRTEDIAVTRTIVAATGDASEEQTSRAETLPTEDTVIARGRETAEAAQTASGDPGHLPRNDDVVLVHP